MGPAMPDSTWRCAPPWKWLWYQYAPGLWSGGSLKRYRPLWCGPTSRKMLSPESSGVTVMPWKCRLVFSAIWLSSVIATVPPGRVRISGAS
ncbi:hypothetical protein D3C81_2131240 [compost metagenome]